MSIQAASRPMEHIPPAIKNRKVHVDGNFGGFRSFLKEELD
jgi:hypothetical protein